MLSDFCMPDILEKRLIEELTTSVDPDVVSFADALAQSLPEAPLGIVFYGSTLRQLDPDGVLDFYIITESARGFTGNALIRLGNIVLPPNVRYAEHEINGRIWRAKIATLSRAQFGARTSMGARDTTLWARFCQPVRLVWVRDASAADIILNLISQSVTTAACWAALLGPAKATAIDYWNALFLRTYAAELRVERKGRGRSLIEGKEERFSALLTLGWARARLQFSAQGKLLEPAVSSGLRKKAARRWAIVHRSGRPRNVARLLKAAFTFQNGASYLAWKIRRHTGHDMQLSSFEARHPILMLPLLLWRARQIKRG